MPFQRCWAGAAVLFLCMSVAPLRAETPPELLRLVPDVADLVIEVRHPRQVAETVTQLDLFRQIETLGPVQEFLDSTSYRRFYQLVAYFEKQLGGRWPELVDQLAGGGMALGVQIGPNPAPALLVIQGTDEKLVRRFADLGMQIIEQELARSETKDRLERKQYRNQETVHAGKEFHAAVAGSALLISNNEKALEAGLDLHLDHGKKNMAQVAALAESHQLLPEKPLVSLWFNLEKPHSDAKTKDVFAKGRDPILTVLFGGWLDTALRAPYLCAGIGRNTDGFWFAFRMPSGRDGGGAEQALHVPPPNDPAPPILTPKGVVLSHYFYFDVNKYWADRDKIFTPEQVKQLYAAEEKSAFVLGGQKLSQLLSRTGAHHRFVAANQRETGYTRKAKQPLPAFALVIELRDPAEFSKSATTVLRGAALLAGSQFKLKLNEEMHGPYKLVGYRFSEDAQIAQDPQDVRFNFSPCFTTVGKYFLASSTLELGRELIDVLDKESKTASPDSGPPAAMRTLVYGEGNADSLRIGEDQLIAQTILNRAVTLDEARTEAKALIDLVRRLGVLKLETNYGQKDFRVDATLKLAK